MNATANYDFTVIVPLYNEEDNIAALERRFAAWLPTAPVRTCVLFVNDGSTDASLPRLKEACARHDAFLYAALGHSPHDAIETAMDERVRHLGDILEGNLRLV